VLRQTSLGHACSTRRAAVPPPHVGRQLAVDPEAERLAAAPDRRSGRRPHPFARSDVVALGLVFPPAQSDAVETKEEQKGSLIISCIYQWGN
jgi:hypothetical protein